MNAFANTGMSPLLHSENGKPHQIPRSPRGIDGCGGGLNIAGRSEFSSDHNRNLPFSRTPEGSPRRCDLMDDIDRMQFPMASSIHGNPHSIHLEWWRPYMKKTWTICLKHSN